MVFLILVPMLGEQILELLRNSKPFTGIIDEINTSNIVIPYRREDLISPFIYTDLIKSINLTKYETLISGYNKI